MLVKTVRTVLTGSILPIFVAAQALASSHYYEAAEAQYVTSSQNPEVLQYIICMESAVGNQPRNMSMQQAIEAGARDCGDFARQLPNSHNEPSAEDIHLNILECGFRSSDASPDADCGGDEQGGNASSSAAQFPLAAGSWGGKVRSGPGMDYDQISSLNEGESVTLLENTGVMMNEYPWFRIEFRGGRTGYKWGGILCATQTHIIGLHRYCSPGTPTTGDTVVHSNADGNGNGNGNIGYPIRIDDLYGTYERSPMENDWHKGNIERNGNGLMWTNFAGVSWSLTPDLAREVLTTGPENPYYAQYAHMREFELIISNGNVEGFKFGGEAYNRTETVMPMNSGNGNQDQIAPQHGNSDEDNDVAQTDEPDDRPAIEQTIRFQSGASSVTISDGVARGERAVYTLNAREGQTMNLNITSLENNAVFQVYYQRVGGGVLPGAGDGQDAKRWIGRLPRTGDYKIVVGATRGGTSYDLFVEIR